MEDILMETVSSADLEKFEKAYNREPNVDTQFSYALCLIRNSYSGDMRKGINLLEDLCERHPEGKRDYIYYLAFGYARLQEYNISLKYIEKFLQIEPNNEQALQLQMLVKEKRMDSAKKGAAVVGGAAMIAGGLLALGFGLLKK